MRFRYLHAAKDNLLNRGIKLVQGKDFYRHVHPYIKTIASSCENITTSLPKEESRAFTSQVVDQAVEAILDEKLFSTKKILAILDPYCFAPLTALLVFGTDKSCRVRVIVFLSCTCGQARRSIATFDGDKASHSRIYEIDENALTVRLTHDFKAPKSKIRSNAIVVGDRVFSMCGFLNKKLDDHAGVILEYNKQSGKVINRYLTYNSFYRAYPFFADCEKTILPLDQKLEYLHCAGELFVPCEAPDTASAHTIPSKLHYLSLPKRNVEQRRGPDKFERMKAYREEHEELDFMRDLAEMAFCFYDELFLVGCRDHLLESIYIVGKQHSYRCDYTNTEQKSPALFESARYYLSLPLRHIRPDSYVVYVQCEGVLYATGKSFSYGK